MAGPFLRDCEKKILFSKFSFNIYEYIDKKNWVENPTEFNASFLCRN